MAENGQATSVSLALASCVARDYNTVHTTRKYRPDRAEEEKRTACMLRARARVLARLWRTFAAASANGTLLPQRI